MKFEVQILKCGAIGMEKNTHNFSQYLFDNGIYIRAGIAQWYSAGLRAG
jgi:hypothetical protein